MNFSDSDRAVSNIFDTYWANFAATGNPSDPGFTELGEFASWPEYTSNDFRKTSPKLLYNYEAKTNSLQARYKKLNRNFNSIFKVGVDPVQASYSNIHIEAPASFLEDEYLEEICDFWDGLNFYVEMKETSTTPQTQDTSTTDVVTSAVHFQEQTTTGSAKQFVPSFFLQMLLILSVRLVVVGRNID